MYQTVRVVTITLYTDKIGIPYWRCIYLFNWNLTIYYVWGNWMLPPGMCSKLLKSFRNFCITITSILYLFYGIGLTLTHTGYTLYQYNKVSIAIFQLPLCSMNLVTSLVLVSFWWREFDEKIAAIPTVSMFHPPIYIRKYLDKYLPRWLGLCHSENLIFFKI